MYIKKNSFKFKNIQNEKSISIWFLYFFFFLSKAQEKDPLKFSGFEISAGKGPA